MFGSAFSVPSAVFTLKTVISPGPGDDGPKPGWYIEATYRNDPVESIAAATGKLPFTLYVFCG